MIKYTFFWGGEEGGGKKGMDPEGRGRGRARECVEFGGHFTRVRQKETKIESICTVVYCITPILLFISTV